MYTLSFNDRCRTWHLNGKIVCRYYYNTPFSYEDCYISWYYISNYCVISNSEYVKSLLNDDTLDNILYTPCNVWITYYDPYDGYLYAYANSYYDIYRFYRPQSIEDIIIYDNVLISKLEPINNLNSKTNLPYYRIKWLDGKFVDTGLNITKYDHDIKLVNTFTKSKKIYKKNDIMLTFGIPR